MLRSYGGPSCACAGREGSFPDPPQRRILTAIVARRCPKCGAAVPWGAPQCVECGGYTHWRSRLATFGLLVGAGTALVVVVSLLRLWLGTPPDELRAAAEVQDFLRRVALSEHASLVAGGGRCKPSIADALCVQTTAEYAALAPQRRADVRRWLQELWAATAAAAPNAMVFVDAAGALDGAPPGDQSAAGGGVRPSQNHNRNGNAAYPTRP